MTSLQNGYVFAYINPDTDGVCSSIVYSHLTRTLNLGEYTPVVFGDINNETSFVLRHFHIDFPKRVSEIPLDSPIVIVDTHHKNQLPANILFENVVEIIDHHPAGDIKMFPNAKIQNESLGAVATILAERIRQSLLTPETPIAGILSAAIISNTLNFSAPSTSERDKNAFTWLQSYARIDETFILDMFKARSDLFDKSTEEILISDYKQFSMGQLNIGISQLETINLLEFVHRPDLVQCFLKIKNSRKLNHFIFNGIDIVAHISLVVATDTETKALLEKALDAKFENNTATFPRILLRKTDFIPKLQALLEK